MVVQLGLATIPFGIVINACAFTSGTTRGTSGSIRHAEELSITIAPAAASRGAKTRDDVAPDDARAISMPEKSAVAASSTSIARPFHSMVEPAERDEAKKRISSTGNLRSKRTARELHRSKHQHASARRGDLQHLVERDLVETMSFRDDSRVRTKDSSDVG